MDTVPLGRSPVRVTRLGVGAWSWGDRAVWGFGREFTEDDVARAFDSSLANGVNWIDTAEMYGLGTSERITGRLATGREVVIATKFLPRPPRRASSLPKALEGSLQRLGRPSVDLYQIHWPVPWLSIDALMERLADAVEAGKARAVGVSNFSEKQMRRAHAALTQRGVPLASNQVEYSLLHREPEANGVLETCRELGATLIAYSPLAMGALSGKYHGAKKPRGPRRLNEFFRGRALDRSAPVIALLRLIAERHGATPSQVALKWLVEQPGVVAIPGAKSERQASENAGALKFRLDPGERDELERATRAYRR